MGIIYDCFDWSVEARTESIIFQRPATPKMPYETTFELDYDELDGLEFAVKKAQEVRRDKERDTKGR